MNANQIVILVNTFHPGNIGSAARAMKTMGITQLRLVQPRCFPDPEATQMAAGAADILEQAKCYDSLQDAVADCTLVIGASARLRSFPLPEVEPPQAGELMAQESQQTPVALVFGRERSGLTNEEITCCTHQVNIPGNPDYNILNVAQAVQVLCYETHMASRRQTIPAPQATPYPLQSQLQHFEAHLEQALTASGFLNKRSGQALDKLHALFRRARPNRKELSLLRGVLTRLEQLAEAEASSDSPTEQNQNTPH